MPMKKSICFAQHHALATRWGRRQQAHQHSTVVGGHLFPRVPNMGCRAEGKISHCEQDSNLRRETPLDFRSNAFTPQPSQPQPLALRGEHLQPNQASPWFLLGMPFSWEVGKSPG